jgi:tetratricopeptide (TPR) repeat protein
MLTKIFDENMKKFLVLFAFIAFFSFSELFSREDDGVSTYWYNGIPGCGCYLHCDCFSHYISEKVSGGFPTNSSIHPIDPEDKIWHTFMTKFLGAIRVGPFLNLSESSIRQIVTGSNYCRYLCLLGEYLNASEKLRLKVEFAKTDAIEWYTKLYHSPKDKDKLTETVLRINSKTNEALKILASIPEAIIPLYKDLLKSCPHQKNSNMVSVYTKGLISLLEDNIEESLTNISQYIELAKQNQLENLLTSEILQKQGEGFFEVGLYDQAIQTLSEAIRKDPQNLEAYFQRASAYFESGNFESSIQDYIKSKKNNIFTPYSLVPNEFIDAFSQAAFEGAYDSAKEFLPSLCSTAYGLGECLWVFGEHPINAIKNLAIAGYELAEHAIDYLKNFEEEKFDEVATELVQLYDNFNSLTPQEKGKLIGYTLGKYGVDIFSGSATVKGISAFKKFKEANRICNLESMATSVSSKESVILKSLEQNSQRSQFFENCKIHWDSQNKHIVGKHNYQNGKSIFEHDNAEILLNKFSGKGFRSRGNFGEPGYRETVDFGEHIGIWKNKDGTLSVKTTKGTIHYSKKGAHIVPENPNIELWSNHE